MCRLLCVLSTLFFCIFITSLDSALTRLAVWDGPRSEIMVINKHLSWHNVMFKDNYLHHNFSSSLPSCMHAFITSLFRIVSIFPAELLRYDVIELLLLAVVVRMLACLVAIECSRQSVTQANQPLFQCLVRLIEAKLLFRDELEIVNTQFRCCLSVIDVVQWCPCLIDVVVVIIIISINFIVSME